MAAYHSSNSLYLQKEIQFNAFFTKRVIKYYSGMGSWPLRWSRGASVRQQLVHLTESSNVHSSLLRETVSPCCPLFSLPPSLPLPSLPPCCRFYELPWALIHLCHTQAPLLGLLTNWLGCRWEWPAGHIWFLQPGQRPASLTTKICGHLGVDKTMASACL